MLGWKVKDKYYATNSSYVICWTGGKEPTYTASYFKEPIIYTKDKQAAKEACEKHNSERLKNV
jgi:hypothetical protein